MVTGQQMIDAIIHADEWPDELMHLRQRVAQLEQERNEAIAKATREQANADFYFQLYLDATKERK